MQCMNREITGRTTGPRLGKFIQYVLFSGIGIEREIGFGPRFLEVGSGFLLFLCCGRLYPGGSWGNLAAGAPQSFSEYEHIHMRSRKGGEKGFEANSPILQSPLNSWYD
jgi:hypothetical protein